ncbi:MAG TPA: thiamine pyrophosphate-binding protein [Casimicrobiaceae bacterium]|nr:thiamine pyrophosphate-binding protein [Casimicrobiaceae bacterium]
MTPRDAAVESTPRFGSDCIAELLRSLDIAYIALTPGASFRGLHDSLVNYLGNNRPELLLCVHEEHAVSLAHGYARVTGRPLAVALHANVGLMHATMAIFNAWCDRVPMLLLGGVGPLDAVKRRPWVDWIHTSVDLASLVRGYTKWDDQPGSVAAALESIVRAHRMTTTAPRAPVYVCLDAALQEEAVDPAPPLPPLERFPQAQAVDPPASAVADVATLLAQARRPLIMIGRVGNHREDFDRRVELAERVQARVLTDLKTAASFPTTHPLHPFPTAFYIGNESGALVREADIILSLDCIDLGGSLRQACGGALPQAKIIQCSLDSHLHNGWSMDYQSLPPTDILMQADPDRLVAALLERLPRRGSAFTTTPREETALHATAQQKRRDVARDPAWIAIEDMARVTSSALASHRPSYIRLPLGWPGECSRFTDPLDFIGFDGGGGIGSGPGMAVGAALALRGSGRLPVAVLGDGDYLMGLTALWTAVHYRIAVLVLVCNNQSFFNDELHQERMARMRGRPVENRWVGLRMNDPPFDLAQLARGQGAAGYGPITDTDALEHALTAAIDEVKRGATCVIDVRVAPEYARAMSSTLLRQIPSSGKGS